MANGNGEPKYKIEKIPGKKKDPPKKSIFETMISPYAETIKSIGKGVKKYINPEMPVSKMKPKGVKDIKTPQKPKDAIVHDMKKQYQGQGKHDYFLKQDNEQIMKDLRKKEAQPPHSINQSMETFVNEKRRSKPKGMSEMEWMENKN